MCQGLGPKKHDEISEIDRKYLRVEDKLKIRRLKLWKPTVHVQILMLADAQTPFLGTPLAPPRTNILHKATYGILSQPSLSEPSKFLVLRTNIPARSSIFA